MFKIGDAVKVIHNGNIGAVIGTEDLSSTIKYTVLVNGKVLTFFEDQIAPVDTNNSNLFYSAKDVNRQININGNVGSPIFGFDSQNVLPSSARYVFTKTYRRIENDTDEQEIAMDKDFENVVIYGHSLSSFDYSYYFPVMDKLRLYDFTATGQMVFAYSVYDQKKENEIKTNYRLAIAKLVEAYAKYKGLTDPNRLLDSLSTFRRVWIYELTLPQYPPLRLLW